jgi:UDP-N-acetylmuramoyl-tripeptide--D-alanyl-D-alanine ligase
MEKMTIGEIAAACGGRLIGKPEQQEYWIDTVTIDSRKALPGSLFIAVKGERLDGHDYIDDAYGNGAACAVSEIPLERTPYILVKSTIAALGDMAAYYRSKMPARVVAITGSVGKTTAKEMIAGVLAQKYNVLKTQGNFNNEFGLPQTVFTIEAHHDVAVLEMGMSGFGEIHNLSRIAQPDVGVIMNIGESHIGNLGSRDGIFRAKCELFDFMSKDALIVLNGDDDKLVTLRDGRKVFFGRDAQCDARLVRIIRADMGGTAFVADVLGETMELFVPKPGEYLIYPALAAAAIGKKMGLTAEMIRCGIESFVPVGMRMHMIRTARITIVNDAYNACMQSILAGAETLRHAPGRKVAIIGDILELGEFGPDIHFETGRRIGALGLDLVICVGTLAAHMCEGAKETSGGAVAYYPTQDALFSDIRDLIADGDTVFVKASRGMQFENIVHKLETL